MDMQLLQGETAISIPHFGRPFILPMLKLCYEAPHSRDPTGFSGFMKRFG